MPAPSELLEELPGPVIMTLFGKTARRAPLPPMFVVSPVAILLGLRLGVGPTAVLVPQLGVRLVVGVPRLEKYFNLVAVAGCRAVVARPIFFLARRPFFAFGRETTFTAYVSKGYSVLRKMSQPMTMSSCFLSFGSGWSASCWIPSSLDFDVDAWISFLMGS